MSTVKFAQGARTTISGAGAAMASLASGAYVAIGTITHSSSGKRPLTCKLEIAVTPGTVSGTLKQLSVFAKKSLDGSNFSTGPESGSTTTDEANLYPIGVIPLNSSSTLQRGVFDLAAALGESLPFATKIIVKNESGATLNATSTNHEAFYQDDFGDIA